MQNSETSCEKNIILIIQSVIGVQIVLIGFLFVVAAVVPAYKGYSAIGIPIMLLGISIAMDVLYSYRDYLANLKIFKLLDFALDARLHTVAEKYKQAESP